jgi:uncharacterized membrane protein YgdD (TMEM256/DUF423 family)
MDRLWLAAGALLGLATVAMSAIAAHALPATLDPAALQSARDTIALQGWHAAALLFCAARAPRGGRLLHVAGALFVVGTLLFCAGVYAHLLGDIRLPMVAPAGGTVLMVGWLALAASALVRR